MKQRWILVIAALMCLLLFANCNKQQENPNASNSPNGSEQSPPSSNSDQAPASDSSSQARGDNQPQAKNKARSVPQRAEQSAAEKPLIVPAGTPVTVRLTEAVGSKISETGSAFSATVARPVEVGGQTVIPEGAEASGTVTEAHAAGRFKGGASLKLTLNSIKVNGRTYDVQSSNISEVSKGKGKRSTVLIGGGAGLGALIGGLAGGGKGALIGGLAGGGAGTAGAGLTGKNDITLPAEAAVTFKLQQPLQVRR